MSPGLLFVVSVLWTAAVVTTPIAEARGADADATARGEEIRRCVAANLPERSILQDIELRTVDRAGSTRHLEARVHWKRFATRPRAMIRVSAPADVKDAAYLLIQGEGEESEQVFVYMPAMKKVRRITTTTASNQLWGTDFSYEDMKHLQGAFATGSLVWLGGGEIEGRPTDVLEMRPATGTESVYERVVSHIDRESCVPLRTEFFERGEVPRKRLDADPSSLSRDGTRWLATRYQMRDRKNLTSTELLIARSEMDAELPDRLFNPSQLGESP